MDVKEKLALSVCNATQKTNFKCEFNCEKKGKCAYCLVMADQMIANGVTVQEWISVDERIPQNFVSVLGYMTDAGEFPPVRECYTVVNEFFFPALGDVHPVSHWCELPQPPKGE